MKKYLIRFSKWFCSLQHEEKLIPEYGREIKCIPVLGTKYTLTMRTIEDVIKYSDSVEDNNIIIGGGKYSVSILTRLIELNYITVSIHETGSWLVFADGNLPDLNNSFASTFLFNENIVDELKEEN